jgi:hypothetical protein
VKPTHAEPWAGQRRKQDDGCAGPTHAPSKGQRWRLDDAGAGPTHEP